MWIWRKTLNEDQLDADSHKSRSAGHNSRAKEHDQQYSPAKAQLEMCNDMMAHFTQLML